MATNINTFVDTTIWSQISSGSVTGNSSRKALRDRAAFFITFLFWWRYLFSSFSRLFCSIFTFHVEDSPLLLALCGAKVVGSHA